MHCMWQSWYALSSGAQQAIAQWNMARKAYEESLAAKQEFERAVASQPASLAERELWRVHVHHSAMAIAACESEQHKGLSQLDE